MLQFGQIMNQSKGKSANELIQLVRKLVPPLSPSFHKGQGEYCSIPLQ
jgi:hypothetical protein